uniref:AP2/ERF domain-containing protein n=1 Tax=Kalanchoe fedtschenkoi TaxID=63787 RepID=A0A7N0TH78_KALFE
MSSHTSQEGHHFSLGLINHNLDTSFQTHEWNLMDTQHGESDCPKVVADFMGVGKSSSHHHSDLTTYNQLHHQATSTEPDYLYLNNTSLYGIQNAVPLSTVTANSSFEYQDNANSLESLTLSMGSNNSSKRSTCETSTVGENSNANSTATAAIVEAAPAARRTLDSFGQRTSIYRGVTRHRWTGRYEAHLWDNSCRREGQSRKGRQGGYDKEDKAARAYDMAALKYWGTSTTTNFPISNYEKELEDMKNMTRQEFVASIRRKSSGFSRGASMYRGVTRHHQHGRWQARIGRVAGNKDLYLGTFSTEEEAAEAYDIAAIKFRGLNAVTNFDMNRYDVKSILESNTLPIGGGAAKRLKEAQAIETSRKREEMLALGCSSSTFHYNPSGVGRLAPAAASSYPLMHHYQFEHSGNNLLGLQNQDVLSHQLAQDSGSYSYLQTQLQLQQQGAQGGSYPHLYNGYLHSNPGFIHGLIGMGGGGSTGGSLSLDHSNNVGYNLGNNVGSSGGGGGLGLGSDVGAGSGQLDLGMVKVDYDMAAQGGGGGGYGGGGWNAEGAGASNGNNGGVFAMWND